MKITVEPPKFPAWVTIRFEKQDEMSQFLAWLLTTDKNTVAGHRNLIATLQAFLEGKK